MGDPMAFTDEVKRQYVVPAAGMAVNGIAWHGMAVAITPIEPQHCLSHSCHDGNFDFNQPIDSDFNILQLAVAQGACLHPACILQGHSSAGWSSGEVHAVRTLLKYNACDLGVVDENLDTVLHMAAARVRATT